MRLRVVLCLLLLLQVPADARELTASETVRVPALAVAQTTDGLVGVAASVEATALAGGAGRVFVDTKPLAQTDMQGSARQAARAAAGLLGLAWQDYDYLVVFRSGSPVIGGPSAGAVMTTALAAALWNLEHPHQPWTLDAGVGATGTINPDGTVGPVGGIPFKAQGAARAGLHTFLYPAGQDRITIQTPQGLVQTTMDEVCTDIGLTCRPVATVGDLIETVAGVRIEPDPVNVPDTREYATLLRPRVEPEVNRLVTTTDQLATRVAEANWTADQAAAVRAWLEVAVDRVASSQDALANGRYYTAATLAFQGLIHAEAGLLRADFYDALGARSVVEGAIAQCAQALTDARAVANATVGDDLHAWQAHGAAVRRIESTELLHAQAINAYQTARFREEWTEALYRAAWCEERAATVHWWAELSAAFGPGPDIAQPQALVRDVLDETRELVQYAEAVLSGAPSARNLLDNAETQYESSGLPGALLTALEAQVQASAAMQVAAADEVPEALLAAAEESASRAIQAARAAGIEPFFAVAQVELASDTTDAEQRLVHLWSARSVALIGSEVDRVAVTVHGPPVWDDAGTAGIVVGMFLGLGVAGMIAVAAIVATRR